MSSPILSMAHAPLGVEASKIYETIYYYLDKTHHKKAIALLEKAKNKAREEDQYCQELEYYLLHGSTIEGRALFSAFGDYFKPNHNEFPPYQFADAVNAIDTAIHHVRLDYVEEGIAFHNFVHN